MTVAVFSAGCSLLLREGLIGSVSVPTMLPWYWEVKIRKSKIHQINQMGQKVNPIGNRVGIIRGWDSNWYGGHDFSSKLVEDTKIREYLSARLAKASISKIVIERTLKLITVTVNTARPGIIIGKGGQEVDKLKGRTQEDYQERSSDKHLRSKTS